MKTLFESMNYAIKNWWISLILGVLFVGLGIFLIVEPLSSYFVLSVLFSITLLLSGVLEIFFSISNKENLSSWGWYLAGGIIDLLLGIFLLVYPLLSMGVIPLIVAFWLMFRGFTIIGYSMDLQRYGVKGWGWYLALGILAILCSFVIIWQPALGVIYIVYTLAITFILIGVFRIFFSFELKKLHNRIKS